VGENLENIMKLAAVPIFPQEKFQYKRDQASMLFIVLSFFQNDKEFGAKNRSKGCICSNR
jgi:hypothetical protein